MIQDIGNIKFDNQYKDKVPDTNSPVLIYGKKEVQIGLEDGRIRYPHYMEVTGCFEKAGISMPPVRYGFSIGGTDYFIMDNTMCDVIMDGCAYIPLHQLREKRPKHEIFAGATGWHLVLWYRHNRFCGVCGNRMLHDERQRMMKCPSCNNMVFPKLQPAVIVGVKDGNRLLMTRYAGRVYKKYALIAGFTEVGETIEETVCREVMEEVGLRVKNITYYKSQPWGFDGDLLMGFFCEVEGTNEIHMDDEELAYAQWMEREDIPLYKEDLSLTGEMMNYFRNGNI